LSVVIGALIVLIAKPTKIFTQILLAFSGAYLLSVTVLHLLPEVFEMQQKNIGLFILLGILMQSILEYFSKGVEHGHIHVHDKISNVPWLLIFSLGLHAFFEGIPLAGDDTKMLLWAIVIHKIPIAIVLTAFLVQSNLSRKIIFLLITVFALMSPLGCILCEQVSFLSQYMTEITAVIIGIFLHISTIILFETSENHTFNIKKFVAIIVAFAIAWMSLI
jgi:zinc transporter ZupT